MLHNFLASHRAQLIERCRSKVADRAVDATRASGGEHRVARFLDQVIATREVEQSSTSMHSVEANDGTLTARDVPGSDCVFAISLPRWTLPSATASATRQ